MSSTQDTLSPLALAILGIGGGAGPLSRRHASSEDARPTPSSAVMPLPQPQRRVTSYSNQFLSRCKPSNDSPPTYDVTVRQSRFPPSRRYLDGGNEILPKYTCTAAQEGPMQMQIESCNPFSRLASPEWREVYVVLRGTQLNIHKPRGNTFSKDAIPAAGKLLRSYTLQHAEIGLARDVIHNVLVPVTRLAHLIPVSSRRRAFDKDPNMFRLVRYFSLRIRAETDQLVLSSTSEEQLIRWVSRICAGIDVSLAIDERSIPRQTTVPRRRRRQPGPQFQGNLSDQRVIEEQERILREMYPAFAEPLQTDGEQHADADADANTSLPLRRVPELTLTTTNDNDQDEIDLSALREVTAYLDPCSAPLSTSRPSATRETTSTSLASNMSTIETLFTTLVNMSADGKWAPVHPQTAAQQARYIRRCMPVLLADSPRASSILVCNGKRMRLNFRMDMMEEWALAPPSYEAHEFSGPDSAPLQPTTTVRSSISARSDAPSASGSEMPVRTASTTTAHDSAMEISAPVTPDTERVDIGFALQKLSLHHHRSDNTPTGQQQKAEQRPEADPDYTLFAF